MRIGAEVCAQRVEEPVLPPHDAHELDLRSGQVDGRRQHRESGRFGAGHHVPCHLVLFDKNLVRATHPLAVVHAESGRGVALGIHVDEEDAQPAVGQ